ncbi:MAG: SDR family oxidoreductase [Streptosporangiales bacterium]|nr:SDR family oxidoreductase [Streptosporangiales bacterium]
MTSFRPDEFALDGRRFLVTGGSRGLGKAMAEGLVAAGARVLAVARGADEGSEGDLHQLAVDVSDRDGLPRLVDRGEELLGGVLDGVVHAAGVQHRSPAVEFAAAEWDRVVATNLTAPFALSQEVGRRQLAAELPGSHVFVASLTSQLGLPNVAAYAATKSGVMGVVRTLAVEWAVYGIRVNAVAPGYFRTQLTEDLFRDDEARARLSQRVPMQRFGQPTDLCGPVVFLVSAASSYVTGQLLTVDGGWTAA